MVLYQCFETAKYFDKETGDRIANYDAFQHVKSSSLSFTAWPKTEYTFKDNVTVKPFHFENVKILWRPTEKQEFNEPDDNLLEEDKWTEEMFDNRMEGVGNTENIEGTEDAEKTDKQKRQTRTAACTHGVVTTLPKTAWLRPTQQASCNLPRPRSDHHQMALVVSQAVANRIHRHASEA